MGKLDSALAKVVQGNYEDAIVKLVAFQDQVETLLGSPKPKIDEDDAIGILVLVADAIAALGAL